MRRQWRSTSEADTAAIGSEIAALLRARVTVYLDGDLGAGKTTLVRGIVAALGVDPESVSSPTFSIVNEYEATGGMIVHLDCYRLSDHPHEWEEIGLRDIVDRDGITFVEWPKEGFTRYVAGPARITVETEEGDARRIVLVLPD